MTPKQSTTSSVQCRCRQENAAALRQIQRSVDGLRGDLSKLTIFVVAYIVVIGLYALLNLS